MYLPALVRRGLENPDPFVGPTGLEQFDLDTLAVWGQFDRGAPYPGTPVPETGHETGDRPVQSRPCAHGYAG